jgi:hypothetical protein
MHSKSFPPLSAALIVHLMYLKVMLAFVPQFIEDSFCTETSMEKCIAICCCESSKNSLELLLQQLNISLKI